MMFENINLHSDISFITSLFRKVALCERETRIVQGKKSPRLFLFAGTWPVAPVKPFYFVPVSHCRAVADIWHFTSVIGCHAVPALACITHYVHVSAYVCLPEKISPLTSHLIKGNPSGVWNLMGSLTSQVPERHYLKELSRSCAVLFRLHV